MSRFSSLLLLCIITLSSFATHAQGRKWGSGIDFTQRAAAREKSRFSLTDWLAMKERNRMMDMWLSLNSPSPFEFMIGGSYISGKSEVRDPSTSPVSSDGTSYSGELAAYAQLVGVSGEYENNTVEKYNDLTGLFNIRLFGNSIQNTGLTLSYGLRTREMSGTTPTRLSQQFGQANLQVYLTKFFGLDGKYRYFLPTDNNELGEVKDDLVEGGLFIDFNAFRIFGTWYKESIKTKIPAATEETLTERTGIRTGLKIFF